MIYTEPLFPGVTPSGARNYVASKLESLVHTISGMQSEIEDVWNVAEQVAGQDVTFCGSVSYYARGYTKMFAAPNPEWNEPNIPEFDPKTFPCR
jgi:hypothetical protein